VSKLRKTFQFAVLGLPSRLISQFSPNMKKTALSGAAPRSILGAEHQKTDRPGTSSRLLWGGEGVGTKVKTHKRGRQQLTLPRTKTAPANEHSAAQAFVRARYVLVNGPRPK
jgi:hypothetical protein